MSVGQIISGRYEIFRKLGSGGMGDVYAANDKQLERKVALKAIRAEYRLEAVSRARFVREARALSKLEHASICRIYDYIAGEDQDYLVLELIEGESLSDRLKKGLGRADALSFAEQIGDALAVAHAEGLVHRDLKPGNVMVNSQGEAKILDFGLARPTVDAPVPRDLSEAGEPETIPADTTLNVGLQDRTMTSAESGFTATSQDSVTEVGSKVGTPRYMSPEQARGEDVGSASDMFAYGLLLHEMFTGKRAYAGPPGEELAEAISGGQTERVQGVDRHLTDLIERLKSPAASRRPTALDAVARLRWIRSKPQRRLRWSVAVLAAVLAVGAGVKYTLDLRRERAAAEFRRKQSDEHIEFMVEGLYKRLEPVGRVDILEDVGLKALEYFETLADAEKTDDDRARLGRTWTQIGHVRLALGEYDNAQDAFERSVTIHQDLVAIDPSYGVWQMGLSGAHFGVANIAWLEDDMDRAAKHFEIYLDISNTLIELEPDNPTYQLELGYALTNMAGLYQATNEPQRAWHQLTQAAAVKRKLLDADPGNSEYRVSLANTLSWLFQVAKDSNDFEAALEHAQAALELRRVLAEDEDDTEAQEHLGISLQQVGYALAELDRPDEAEQAFREDVAIALRLSRLDPDNREWRSGLAVSWRSLGRFYLDQERYDDARPLLENAFRVSKSLFDFNADDLNWQYQFQAARHRLALLEFHQRRPREALNILMDGAVTGDLRLRVREWILLARVHHRLGDQASTTNALDRAEEILQQSPDDRDTRDIALLRDELGA